MGIPAANNTHRVAEALWASLKRELVHRRRFATRAEARQAIFVWINYCNRTRRHSTLGCLAPNEWEQRYRQDHPVSGAQAA